MKTSVNVIPVIIAVAVATLIGLLVATLCDSKNDTVIGIATGVSLAVTLLPMLAIKTNDNRLNVNLRLVSTIFTILVLLVNVIVCFSTPNKLTIYFIVLGLILLIFIGVLYSLIRSSE